MVKVRVVKDRALLGGRAVTVANGGVDWHVSDDLLSPFQRFVPSPLRDVAAYQDSG